MTPFESVFFYVALAFYIAGAIAYTFEFFLQTDSFTRWGRCCTLAAWLFHAAALVLRAYATGHAPMSNMYESLSFFAWGTASALLYARARMGVPAISAFTAPLYVVLMLLAYAFKPDRVPTLVPALQSWLLPAHVMLAFLGEAWFVIGFAAALMYLFRKAFEDGCESWTGLAGRLPESGILDSLSYRAISLGYPLFTLGALVLGMLWAHRAWGRYWGWDPKEVWALVTFIVYSLYLHGRLRWGWRGRLSAYLAVLGFVVTLFTLFGVNFLLSGLHSYL